MTGLRQRLGAITFWVLLLAPLTISPVLGLLTPYATLLFIIPLFLVKIYRGQFGAAYSSYAARAFLVVFAVLAVICVVTAAGVPDALKAFNFTMLLAYGAVVYFLAGHSDFPGRDRTGGNVSLVTTLAGAGVVLGLLEILFSAFVQHLDRPTGPAIGPIVLSNGLLALGFLGLGGALLRRGAIDWAYVAIPIMAIAATLLTESRGPLIAVPFATVFAAIYFWRVRFDGSARAGFFGLLALAAIGAGGAFLLMRSRGASIISIVDTVVNGGSVADPGAGQRLALYKGGWQAFLDSPWIGHGWGRIMSSVMPFLPVDGNLLHLPQLHNDVLNFAVAGGVIGIGCYVAILTAPLIGAVLSSRDELKPFRIYATAVIMIVYAGGGLTDLMFGFEFHTFLFAMLNAVVLGYCRRAPVRTVAS